MTIERKERWMVAGIAAFFVFAAMLFWIGAQAALMFVFFTLCLFTAVLWCTK